MKIAIITLIAFAFSITLFSFAKPNADTYSLTIEVKNLRNAKGVVQYALYNKDGSIPDEDYENYYKILKGEIVNGSSTITFKKIPSGKYAVNNLLQQLTANYYSGFSEYLDQRYFRYNEIEIQGENFIAVTKLGFDFHETFDYEGDPTDWFELTKTTWENNRPNR